MNTTQTWVWPSTITRKKEAAVEFTQPLQTVGESGQWQVEFNIKKTKHIQR